MFILETGDQKLTQAGFRGVVLWDKVGTVSVWALEDAYANDSFELSGCRGMAAVTRCPAE